MQWGVWERHICSFYLEIQEKFTFSLKTLGFTCAENYSEMKG